MERHAITFLNGSPEDFRSFPLRFCTSVFNRRCRKSIKQKRLTVSGNTVSLIFNIQQTPVTSNQDLLFFQLSP